MNNKTKLNAQTSSQGERPIPQSAPAVNPGPVRPELIAERESTPELFDERYDNMPCTD
ncbi:MAG: hypothetical protein ABI461_03395 [Polyangiaceae bacterium]